jgi:hypothetical protein
MSGAFEVADEDPGEGQVVVHDEYVRHVPSLGSRRRHVARSPPAFLAP